MADGDVLPLLIWVEPSLLFGHVLMSVTFCAKNLEFSIVQGEQRFLTAIDDLQSNLGLNYLPPESKLSN